MSSLTAEIDVSDGLAVRVLSHDHRLCVTVLRQRWRLTWLSASGQTDAEGGCVPRCAQHVGLEEYAPLFVQHEIGRPMLELLNEERSIWPELFASDLSSVRPEHRDRMVEATPTILEFCAARCKEEDDLATKYLGLTPRSKRKMEAERAWAEAAPRPPPRAAAPKEPSLPGARPEDGCIGLWLEKKSPSVVKGWQRRWFVLNPQGELQYYTDPSKENLGAKGKQKQNQALFLKNCTKITSNNMDSGHFELHFPNKMIELRVEDVSQPLTL